MPHDPLASVLDMIHAIERAEKFCAGMAEPEFLANEPLQWAVYSQVVILGEAAGRVDTSFQAANPGIPWSSAIGMRHRLVHGYDSVDWKRVWTTMRDDLPPLLKQLRSLLPNEGGVHEP